MTHWIGRGDPEWKALLLRYESSCYRLECQQLYASDEEDEYVSQFLAGRRAETDWEWMRATAGTQVAAGRTKIRMRVFVEPLTQYAQMALTVLPELAEIGEDIRVLTVQQGEWPAGQPHHDYFMFDDRELWIMNYHENFRFRGASRVDDPAAIADHRRARDLAMATAVPFVDYLKARQHDKEHSSA